MLSYQHIYHAGNFADVHKHTVLSLLLAAMSVKEKPFFVLDAFAGRGGYEFRATEAEKTGEYHEGVEKIWSADGLPKQLSAYIDAVRQFNGEGTLNRYPGSPWLIRHMIREQDRMALCELHPQEFEALRGMIRSERRVSLHKRDGLDAMKAMLPPKERRGLLLIDPAYEVKSEYEAVADAVIRTHHHWREGVYAIWYPLLAAGNHEKLLNMLKRSGIRKVLNCTLSIDGEDAPGMFGSGMIVINPPWKLDQDMKVVLPWLVKILGRDERGDSSVRWLVPE